MGRHGKRTGSPALGDWLRRKRAGRTLRHIAGLSSSEPLKDWVRPIAVPTLSLLESATTLPNAESIHTLASIYRVTTDEIHEVIAGERRTALPELPATEAATLDAYRSAATAARYQEAVALAMHGEALAGDAAARVLWRARRGACLPHVGKAAHAIRILKKCWESEHLPTDHAFVVLRSLADAEYLDGNLRTAVLVMREAIAAAPADLSGEARLGLLVGAISMAVARLQVMVPPPRREVRETIQQIAEARSLLPAEDKRWALALRMYEAMTTELQGNTPVAARDYRVIAQEAALLGHAQIECQALAFLGVLRRKQGKLTEAEKHLEAAENRSVAMKSINDSFQIAFELLLVAKAMGDVRKEKLYYKRCERHYPLVTVRSPQVLGFEGFVQSTT